MKKEGIRDDGVHVRLLPALVVVAILLATASVAAAGPGAPVVQGYQVSGSTTASASLVLDKPTGVQVGELLLLIVGNDDATAGAEFTDNLAGWNYTGTGGDSSADADIGAFWRIANGTEGSTVAVTATSSDEWFGWYIRISGADSTNPINASNFAQSSANTDSHVVPGVATGVDNCLAIYALSFDGGDGYPFTVGTGWTETAEYQTGTSGTGDVSTCWGTKEQASAGGTGDATVGCSVSDGAAYFQLAIAPAPDTTPPMWQNQDQNNSAPAEGEAVLLYAQGKDETALDFAVLETNETGGWQNITDGSYGSPMDMGDAVDTWTWSNFTWQNSSITAGTTVGWRIWYNDTSNNWNKTDIISFTVQSADNNPPGWSDAQTNKTLIYENDYVKFAANWTDDVALAGHIFSINQTGTWVNSSFVSFSGTSNTSENTTQIIATAGTTVGWRFYANDTSDNGNATDIQSFVVASPPPPPSSPYMIYGWAFYKNGTACNDPVVNITNLNSSTLWQAGTNVSYNYYQIMLANGSDLNASEILQFSVKAPDGSQCNTIDHTVTQDEINDGGLFAFNITLEAPVTPFMIYGWVNYSNGTACNNPTVNITNANTSMQWQAETNASYNYYQLILDTTNVSAGDLLEFNVTDGTEYNTTNHTVTAGDIDSGGVFDFNLTLPSAPPTEGPTVDSITITPDDDGATSGVQINPYPDGVKNVTVSAVVSDPNGYGDISTVNITDIAPDPDHGDPSPIILVLQSGSGTTATYNGTFDMQFYDAPIEYTVTVTAKDTSGSSDADSSTFNYTSCTAMSLDSGTIAFGSIDPGENNTVSGDVDMGTTGNPTVRNTGNMEIDVNMTGSDMISGGDTITKDRMDAQVAALGYSDLGVARCFDANMTAGASSLESVDFRLNVPYGTPVGSYNGSVTLTVHTCGGS